MEEKKKLRAVAYVRVSTKEQDEEWFWEELQIAKIKSYIDVRSNDMEFATRDGEPLIYKDLAVSGADIIDERPWMMSMFDDLEYSDELPFDIVIVYKIDRFARKLSVLLDVVDKLKLYEVWFISTQESIDTNSAFGNAMLGILGVFAELEKDMIQERTSSGRAEFLKTWWWVQDKYGYDRIIDNWKKPVVNQREAGVIKKIFDSYLLYNKTVAEITRELSNAKILIPSASKWKNLEKIANAYFWRTETVRDILRDEAYIGKYYYNKTQRVVDKTTKKKKQVFLPKEKRTLSPIEHMAIIEKEDFDKVQYKLEHNAKEYGRAKNRYILSWMIKCDYCKRHRNRWMVQWTGTTTWSRAYYMCSWKGTSKNSYICPSLPLWKDDLEALVLYYVKQFLIDPEAITNYLDTVWWQWNRQKWFSKKLSRLIDNINKKSMGLLNIKAMFEMDDIGIDEYRSKRDKLEKEKKELEVQKAKVKRELKKNVDEGRYKKSFKILSWLLSNKLEDIFSNPDKTHKLLSFLIEEIVVYSRNKTRKDVIAWRKRTWQKVPHRLVVKFRLPQEFLTNLVAILLNNKDIRTSKELHMWRLKWHINDVEDLIFEEERLLLQKKTND